MPTTIDQEHELPRDVFEVIFGYLDIFCLYSTFQFVSKRWYELVRAHILPELDITKPFPDPVPSALVVSAWIPSTRIKSHSIIPYVQKIAPSISEDSTAGNAPETSRRSSILLSRHLKVRSLKIIMSHPSISDYPFELSKTLFGMETYLQDLQILDANLSHVELLKLPHLRRFALICIDNEFSVARDIIRELIQKFQTKNSKKGFCSLLEELQIEVSNNLDPSSCLPAGFLPLLNSLKRLKLGNQCFPTDIVSIANQLTTLSFGIYRHEVEPDAVPGRVRFKSLDTLTIHCNNCDLKFLNRGFAPKLKNLSVKKCGGISKYLKEGNIGQLELLSINNFNSLHEFRNEIALKMTSLTSADLTSWAISPIMDVEWLPGIHQWSTLKTLTLNQSSGVLLKSLEFARFPKLQSLSIGATSFSFFFFFSLDGKIFQNEGSF
jgi:hypothetical protein